MCCIYTHSYAPCHKYEDYVSEVEEALIALESSFRITLLGDLNLPDLNWRKNLSQKFLRGPQHRHELFVTSSPVTVQQLNRSTSQDSRGVLFDIVLSTDADIVVTIIQGDRRSLLVKEDGHHTAFYILQLGAVVRDTSQSLVYNFRRCNLEEKLSDLQLIDLQAIVNISLPDIVLAFYDIVNEIKI